MLSGDHLHGIVLTAYDIQDSSRIVRLFTKEEGKLSFIARGARRNKSRVLNLTEPFMEGTFQLQEGRSLLYIRDGQIQEAHLGLRRRPMRLACAQMAVEAMGILPEREPDPGIYALLQRFLMVLEDAADAAPIRLLSAFLMKMASFLGFRPTLGACLECGKRMNPSSVFFDIASGGVFCEDHREVQSAKYMATPIYEEICAYITQPLQNLEQTAASGKKELYQGAFRITLEYFQTHTGKQHFKSLAILQRLAVLW